MADHKHLSGRCMCGDVKFHIHGEPSNAGACHCTECRKWSGHYWATFSVRQDELVLDSGAESLAWYPDRESERGFCVICGSSLFFRRISEADPHVAVALGAVDGDTGITMTRHIYTHEKGDYYRLPPDAEPEEP